MTEAEWLGCNDPDRMLTLVRGSDAFRRVTCGTLTMWFEVDVPGPTSQHQPRPLACACARRVWHLLGDERSRALVEASERFADGVLREQRLSAIWARAVEAYLALDPSHAVAPSSAHPAASCVLGLGSWLDVSHVIECAGNTVVSELGERHLRPERADPGGVVPGDRRQSVSPGGVLTSVAHRDCNCAGAADVRDT